MTIAENAGELGRYRPYPEYKDSGLEWLGEIPTHWDVLRLKAIADVRLSNVDKKSFEEQEAVRLCNYTDVYYNGTITSEIEFMPATATTEQIKRFSLRPGDVLITKDSESWDDIAVPAVVVEELDNVLCGYHLALIRPNTGVDGRFLARSFSAIGLQDQFQIAANGITRYGLSGGTISSASFSIPPHPEQQAIADFLDRKTAAIDALIAKKERLIELLQQKRAAIITQAVTKGLDPTVPMKESGVEWLGRVPAHWEVHRTKNLFRLVNEKAPEGHDYELISLYADIGVRPRADLEPKGNKASTTEGYWLVRKGDIVVNKLLAWMRAIGFSDYEGVTSPAYDILRKTKPLESEYYHYLFRTDLYITQFRRHSRGIMDMRLRLYFDELGQIPVPYPPACEQAAILTYIKDGLSPLEALVDRIRAGVEALNEYRTALISAAVTGKIDVRQEVG